MNALVDRMVQEGLIEESEARGIHGLLAKGEPRGRAGESAGLEEEEFKGIMAREIQRPEVEI